MAVKDRLQRDLSVGDFVVFTDNIYRVKEITESRAGNWGWVKIMLIFPSKTTRPVKKISTDCFLIPKEDVIVWMIKEGISLES